MVYIPYFTVCHLHQTYLPNMRFIFHCRLSSQLAKISNLFIVLRIYFFVIFFCYCCCSCRKYEKVAIIRIASRIQSKLITTQFGYLSMNTCVSAKVNIGDEFIIASKHSVIVCTTRAASYFHIYK